MRYGMVIDLKRCIGCNSCTVACKQRNATPPGIFWSWVLVGETGTYPAARLTQLPLLCMHCKDAPCVEVCPTGASQKRDDGIVFVDASKCIGCRACMVACPYEARSYNSGPSAPYYSGKDLMPFEKAHAGEHHKGTVSKCNFCLPLVDKGEEPMCVHTCPTKARIFGDLDDPESEVSTLILKKDGKQLNPEFETDPSVYYLMDK